MTGPITVAVNLTWIAPGRVGGSEEYLVRQLSGLPSDGEIEPTLFCQPSFVHAYPELTSRFATVPMPIRRDWRAARILAEHTWLATRSRHAQVAHHGGGTAPLVGGRPAVVTVHDLQYLRFPEYFSAARRAYLGRMMPRSIDRAAVVATPSEYVRGRVIEAFAADPARVVVVPHGIPASSCPDASAIAEVRARLGLGDRPFLVYPAITHPHKRHLLLVEMMQHLDTEIALVLIGGSGSSEFVVQRAAARSGDRVLRLGRVDAALRDALIAGASALVFPSEYEGFGAPLVEAMAFGTPVVCSDRAAIPEVVGDAGVVVAEPSPEAWASAVIEAGRRRTELVEAGYRRRSRFTTDESGRVLAAAYRRAVAT